MGIIYILMILFEGVSDYIITFISAILLVLFFNISLAFFVYSNAKSRQLDNKKTWAVLTGIFGLPIAVLFLLMNIKLGVKNEDKRQKRFQRNALIICAAALVLSSVCYPIYKYEDRKATLNSQYESSLHKPYLNEDESEYIFYDKMGKIYHIYDEEDIPLYTPDETMLKYDDYSDEVPVNEYDFDKYYIRYVSADRSTVIDIENALINQDGFIVAMDKSKLICDSIEGGEGETYEWEYSDEKRNIYHDTNGNLYFEPEDCSWDKNGNLVFRNEYLTEYVKNAKGN
ncbi:MAG: hypothetical protein E7570_08430 [Ruminococcaceae bacterium]|nr:hypothetical protein [Oscillospiraceae bacterium]